MEIKHCKRCGEDWCYRGTGRPIRCGVCKSPYWDRDRRIDSDEALWSKAGGSDAKVESRRGKGGKGRGQGAKEDGPAIGEADHREAGRVEPRETADAAPSGRLSCPACGGMYGVHQKWCKEK